MSQEKTEKATAKRRNKARGEGQVAQSKDLVSAITLFTGMLVLNVMMGNLVSGIKELINDSLTFKYGILINEENIIPLMTNFLFTGIKLVLPFLTIAALVGVLATILQVGPFFSMKMLKPKLSNISLIKGFKNLFSLKSLVELAKALFKITIIVFIAYLVLKNEWKLFFNFSFIDVEEAAYITGTVIFKLGIIISIVMIGLGVADFIYQKYEFEKSIKMSKDEIKREYKESEGDPLIVSKRKERMRQLAMNRMIQQVPEADVIITNPTHIAVALKYDTDTMEAPIVLAMGEDKIAERIREIAKENKIEMYEDKPLARALYKTAEVGQSIPFELYQAVAEVLAFVYKLQKRNI
ncbi:MAG: flagellar biosynthesis protein FlhB [Halanaerobiales bacterium]|nr:flagellar biosynthesis protein FlhB [Halanaerobiales bacterium]